MALRPAWLAFGPLRGGTDGRMDGRTNEQTENLPILQDFVPYRGRCPATAQLQPKNYMKRGKGTADHMMPLGNWFVIKNHVYKNVEAQICEKTSTRGYNDASNILFELIWETFCYNR